MLYRSLFSLRGILPTAQGDFLRIAFLRYIKNDWKPVFIDQKLMRHLRTGQADRFISKAAFARRYGIHTRTAARFLEDQGLPSRTFVWGTSERKLIDSAAARLSPTLPGKIYRVRQAAAMIGISVELLKCLKANGDFEVNHQLRTKECRICAACQRSGSSTMSNSIAFSRQPPTAGEAAWDLNQPNQRPGVVCSRRAGVL